MSNHDTSHITRQPAGSPDGGKFAPGPGAVEADSGVLNDGPDLSNASKAQARELTAHHREYAELGLRVAALLGSNTEWSGADMLEAIAEETSSLGLGSVGSQSDEELARWREVADEYGYDHDEDEAM